MADQPSSSKPKPKVIVSFDVENDGPSILWHSCLMLGFAVIKMDDPPIPDPPDGTSGTVSAPAVLQPSSSSAPPVLPSSSSAVSFASHSTAPSPLSSATSQPSSSTAPQPSSSSAAALPAWLLERKAWYTRRQPGKEESTLTMNWWNETPRKRSLLREIRSKGRPLAVVMPEVWKWIQLVHERYDVDAYVCMPTSFDYQWLLGLLHKFDPKMEKIRHQARCLSTMRWVAERHFGIDRDTIGRCPDFEYTHRADEDAARQGWIYKRLLALMDEAANRGAVLNPGAVPPTDASHSGGPPNEPQQPSTLGADASQSAPGLLSSTAPQDDTPQVRDDGAAVSEEVTDLSHPTETDFTAVIFSGEASQPTDDEYDHVVQTDDGRPAKRPKLD